jgi:hypothetical protein
MGPMNGLDDYVDPAYYGQATDSGMYDDVETYGDGSAPNKSGVSNGYAHLAWLLIVLALAGLWLMGAFVFKGSNHS